MMTDETGCFATINKLPCCFNKMRNKKKGKVYVSTVASQYENEAGSGIDVKNTRNKARVIDSCNEKTLHVVKKVRSTHLIKT
ncbi:MAG: hypothetical protein EOO03_15235 [Chitinophagaceae bacterium]|nr:MAG: hypothetical protein EOO03_15235 [Chitinophagaceae bacterium]